MANTGYRSRKQLEKFWVVYDLRPRGIANKFAERRKHFSAILFWRERGFTHGFQCKIRLGR